MAKIAIGSEEQYNDLLKVIADLRNEPGCLMPIMQQAQDIYGYLPIEVQRAISDELNVPMEKIYGVATFYTQFNLNPKGKYQISVCLGTACYVKGAGKIFESLKESLKIDSGECTEDGKFSLDAGSPQTLSPGSAPRQRKTIRQPCPCSRKRLSTTLSCSAIPRGRAQ